MSGESHQVLASPESASGVNQSQLEYAGLGRRSLARLIDILVTVSTSAVAAGLILRSLTALGIWQPFPDGGDLVTNWSNVEWVGRLLVVIAFFLSTGPIYFVLFESSSWQATLGKRLLSIYVAGQKPGPISMPRSLGRHLVYYVTNWTSLILVSIITIVVSKSQQAVHDFAAKTFVLRGQPNPDLPLDRWRVATSFGVPLVWVLGTFILTM